MLNKWTFVFIFQTAAAIAAVVFATQEAVHGWASVGTFVCLMLWLCSSFILTLAYLDLLSRRFPWSFYAVVVPVAIWLALAYSLGDVDSYLAAVLCPVWIAAGLVIFAAHGLKIKCKQGSDIEMAHPSAQGANSQDALSDSNLFPTGIEQNLGSQRN